MPYKKNLFGMKKEKTKIKPIKGIPSVNGKPAIDDIIGKKSFVLTLDDMTFISMMAGVRTAVFRNESGTEKMTFELRLVERCLPMSYGGWTSAADKLSKDIIGDAIKKIVPEVRGPEPWRNLRRYPSKSKRRKP